ncbi:hypothetical protein C8Q75DRAFT_792147 [Abortiporus biennis]|nr:hypothetical protein C8Q75DRAFT_792147 [Abortiporus biennis]
MDLLEVFANHGIEQEIGESISVTTHSYIEASLCERFTQATVFAWVSASNYARIYHLEHVEAERRFLPWPVLPHIMTEIIWDTFFVYALLRDHNEHSVALMMSNEGDWAGHLEGEQGQEYWNHIFVMDGVTVSHLCCNVHDCKFPLPNQCAQFCKEAHQNLNTLFQLRKHLERHGLVVSNEVSNIDLEDSENNSGNLQCPQKSDSGDAPQIKITLNRRRTHNEQLCMATYSVVLGRAMFYGSEGINSTCLFLRHLFPTEASMPQVIFYDNAYSLKKHILAINDHHFDNCLLPVDVFHARTKHKDSDEFCGCYCNPALFPDLLVKGKWRFNSSATEMTNTWFGSFRSITRKMREDCFDFLLDEVINQHNRASVQDLADKGFNPCLLHHDILLPIPVNTVNT